MRFAILFILIFALIVSLPAQSKKKPQPKRNNSTAVKKETKLPAADSAAVKPRITFYELGSVKCIPCKKMQPVMKSIEEKYAGRVSVVFYDVWKEDQKQYAEKFGIKLIPTQVFVDQSGKELMRHEGFFPEKDIDAFLRSKGIQPNPSPKGS